LYCRIASAYERTNEIFAAHKKPHGIDAVSGPPVGRFYFGYLGNAGLSMTNSANNGGKQE
jgi:hypothetical protein